MRFKACFIFGYIFGRFTRFRVFMTQFRNAETVGVG